jgi:hypothetical protein
MAHARQRHDWRLMASLMALIAEPNRNPKKRSKPFVPSDFDPFEIKDKKAGALVVSFAELGAMFKGAHHDGVSKSAVPNPVQDPDARDGGVAGAVVDVADGLRDVRGSDAGGTEGG